MLRIICKGYLLTRANQAAILCRDAGGLYLLRGGLQGAARMELPETVRQSARMLRVFGSAVAVGVWRGDMIYIEHSGQKMFKTLQLPVPPAARQRRLTLWSLETPCYSSAMTGENGVGDSMR